jgi:hypothetical protein
MLFFFSFSHSPDIPFNFPTQRLHSPCPPHWLLNDLQQLISQCFLNAPKSIVALLERYRSTDQTFADKIIDSLSSHSYTGSEEEYKFLEHVRSMLLHAATATSNTAPSSTVSTPSAIAALAATFSQPTTPLQLLANTSARSSAVSSPVTGVLENQATTEDHQQQESTTAAMEIASQKVNHTTVTSIDNNGSTNVQSAELQRKEI